VKGKRTPSPKRKHSGKRESKETGDLGRGAAVRQKIELKSELWFGEQRISARNRTGLNAINDRKKAHKKDLFRRVQREPPQIDCSNVTLKKRERKSGLGASGTEVEIAEKDGSYGKRERT